MSRKRGEGLCCDPVMHLAACHGQAPPTALKYAQRSITIMLQPCSGHCVVISVASAGFRGATGCSASLSCAASQRSIALRSHVRRLRGEKPPPPKRSRLEMEDCSPGNGKCSPQHLWMVLSFVLFFSSELLSCHALHLHLNTVALKHSRSFVLPLSFLSFFPRIPDCLPCSLCFHRPTWLTCRTCMKCRTVTKTTWEGTRGKTPRPT